METVLFKSETKKDVHAVADFLHQLADKIAAQEVVLKQGADELKLIIPSTVVFELKVKEKTKPTKPQVKKVFEVELEWLEGDGPHTSDDEEVLLG